MHSVQFVQGEMLSIYEHVRKILFFSYAKTLNLLEIKEDTENFRVAEFYQLVLLLDLDSQTEYVLFLWYKPIISQLHISVYKDVHPCNRGTFSCSQRVATAGSFSFLIFMSDALPDASNKGFVSPPGAKTGIFWFCKCRIQSHPSIHIIRGKIRQVK